MNSNAKKELIKRYSPHSRVMKNSISAFLVGGALCAVAELFSRLLIHFGTEQKLAATLVTVSFITLGAFLTGIGVFDRIARFAGAGTLVPVTGFSNAVVSEAMDARSEGVVLGVGAKIFTVSGPVILFGLTAGFIYGVIYFFYLYFTGSF